MHYVFGLHAVRSILEFQRGRILHIYIQKDKRWNEEDKKKLTASGISFEYVNKDILYKFAQSEQHQGIVAACKPPKMYNEHDLLNWREDILRPLFLILDGVEDPHNLGACLRTADAAGVHAVIVPKHHAAGLTPAVCKVASGAAETVRLVMVTNLVRTMEQLKETGVWMFGLAGEAEKNIFQNNFNVPAALILGAEGTGLRRLTREHCDELIKIPMLGNVSSLNVSVAAGVGLFEVVRQRENKP